MTARRTTTHILLCAALLALGPAAMPTIAQQGASLAASLSTSRGTPFVNEIFELTITVRTTGRSLGEDIEIFGLPEPDVLELQPFEELPVQRKRAGAEVTEIHRYRCKGRVLRPGPVEIAPTLRITLVTRRRLLLGSTLVSTPRRVAVRPLTLTARPLPRDDVPAEFSGAIGRFSFDVDVEPRRIVPGDLVTATMRVGGTGYLRDPLLPRFSPGEGFKVYDPRVVRRVPDAEWVVEQQMIPQTTNAVGIPGVSFAYFDPQQETYRRVSRGPFALSFHERERIDFKAYRPEPPQVAKPGAIARFPPAILLAAATVLTGLLALAVRIRQGPCIAAGVLGILFAAGITIAAVHLATWHLARRRLAHVVIDGTARFAPSVEARETFRVRVGASVEVVESRQGWVKVQTDAARGWMPSNTLDRVPEG